MRFPLWVQGPSPTPQDISMKEENLCQAFSDALLCKIEDIDTEDWENPQLCSDYVKDIYQYLRQLEVRGPLWFGCTAVWNLPHSWEGNEIRFFFFYFKKNLFNGTPLQYSWLENPMDRGAWWAAVHGVTKSRTRRSDFTFTFHFHAWEKDMATHSSVLAWRIPGTAEPGGLPSMGSHTVGHD